MFLDPNLLQAASEDAKQRSKPSASCTQAAAASKIPLAPQARHAEHSDLPHKTSSKQSALVKPAAPSSNNPAMMASSRFPGFAVKPSQDTAVSGVELVRGNGIPLKDHEAVPGLEAPIQSPEVTLHGQSAAKIICVAVPCLALMRAPEFCDHHAHSVSCRHSLHHVCDGYRPSNLLIDNCAYEFARS